MARAVFSKRLRHRAEYALVRIMFALLGVLPVDAASAFGGFLGRVLGPLLPRTRVARDNLRHAFPEKSEAEIAVIVRGMWDNLGRTVCEYPHIDGFLADGPDARLEVVNSEVSDYLREHRRSGIFVSGHFANWEMAPITAARYGLATTAVYRQANNPYIDRYLKRLRAPIGVTYVPKGAAGARDIVATLKRGDHLAILVDQKFNEGVAVPFFGRLAMTASAHVELAARFGAMIIPARTVRLKGARFRLIFCQPMAVPKGGDRQQVVREFLVRINEMFESWIREHPEQWMWIHRRWPKQPLEPIE